MPMLGVHNLLHRIAKSVTSFAKKLQKKRHFRQPLSKAL